ncbi:MAG: DUF5668 domain-containing protein [Bacteroidetes bacterium]|nr:DUF5668 domain-containing protein [Bacteroidota bacterium]
MKYKHLFWGLILITIGLLFILNNLGVIHFSWYSVLRLWPLILLFWGIAILPVKDGIKYTLLGVVLLSTIFIINRIPDNRPWYLHFHHPGNSFYFNWDDENEDSISRKVDQNLSVPFDSLSLKGSLKLDAAAGTFKIKGTTNEFLTFSKSGDIGDYEMTTKDEKGKKIITLDMKEGNSKHNSRKNEVNISLNSKPAWNMDMSIGAADVEFDLSEYRIDTAKFEAGASSIDIRLGNKNPKTVLVVAAGASSIHVEVPKTSGCQVTSESFLASRTLEGFENKGNHVYQTPGFNADTSKIYITIKTAVSSIDVTRY